MAAPGSTSPVLLLDCPAGSRSARCLKLPLGRRFRLPADGGLSPPGCRSERCQASRPRKTTVNLTFAEEDALEHLIRELRRRTGGAVSKDETWRALLVWAARQDSANFRACRDQGSWNPDNCSSWVYP